MAKALKIIGTVAIVAGLTLVTAGAASGLAFGALLSTSVAGIGISAGTLLTAGALLGAASSILAPGVKTPKVSAATADRLQVSINTRAPRLSVFGSTAMGTDLRDQEYSDNQTYLHRWVVSAGHAVRAIREIWFDDKLAWTSTGGVTSEFAGYLQIVPVLEGSAANAINTGPRMGSSRRYTGCAYVYFRYKLTGNSSKATSPFAQSIPSRVTIVGDGMPVYDPRQDSSRGGSGPCRADDQSTWIRTDEACRNPPLQLLSYLLGWRINGRLSVGKGIPPTRIDIESFAVAANICDEPVARSAGGFEPRYRSDGVFSEADELSVVYDTFKATMNAIIDDVGGRQRLQILHNDLGTPIGSLTTADVLGAFTWDQTPALQQTINVIHGGYTDPSSASLYQLIEGPEIRGASPDGIDREQKIDLPMVQSPSQRSRLLLMRLQRIISGGGTFTAEFQATGWKFQKGDVVRFTFAPLGWVNKLFRIADLAVQVDGVVPMMLREEHPDIYLGEGNDAAAIVGAEPTRYDWTLNPLLQDLEDVANSVSTIVSDNQITMLREKRQLIRDWSTIEAQFLELDQKYVALGSPSELYGPRSDAAAGYTSLAAFLASLSPAWDDVNQNTPVNGAELNRLWILATQAIEAFAAAITGRPGASSVTLIANTSTTIVYPGALRGTANTGWGYDAAYSKESYGGGAVASFTLPAVHGDNVMVGLTQGSGTDRGNSYDSITFALHRNDQGMTQAFVNGIGHGAPGPVVTGEMAGRVQFDGRVVRWFVNEAQIAEFTWLSPADDPYAPGHQLRFRATLASIDPRINDITFVPAGTAGKDGAPGLNGTNGVNGTNGANGQTSFVHFAFANSPDGTLDFTTGAADGRYFIGVYTDFDAADSTNPASYTWSPFRGTDGTNGIPGAPGANGESTYVHIAYANSPDGTADFTSGAPGSRTYIGLRTDFVLEDSTNPGDYTWSLIKGADGISPPVVTVSATPQAIRYDKNGAIASGPVTFTAVRQNAVGPVSWASVVGHQLYGIPGLVDFSGDTMTISAARMNDVLVHNAIHAGGPQETIVAAIGGASARVTVTKIQDGADGTNGLNGTNGINGTNGTNGQTSYVHFAFANSADGSVAFTTGAAEGRYYIGTYTDFTEADSTNPASYTWSLFRGADGTNGIAGANGTSVHIAYANSADGTVDFHLSDGTNRSYIGTYTDTTLADSTNPAMYTWSLIKGAQGPQGPTGTTAPQPKKAVNNITQLDDILLEPGATLTAEGSAGVQAGSAAGNVTSQIQVAVNNGGFTVVGSNSDAYVTTGEPDITTVAGAYTNSSGARVFLTVRLVLSGPSGFSIRGDTSNYLRIL